MIYSLLYQDTKSYNINISNIKQRNNKCFLIIHSVLCACVFSSVLLSSELYIYTLDFMTHFR